MLKLIVVVSVLISNANSWAGTRDVQVFEVRRNFQTTPEEPVLHDYYVNAGSEEGLKSGMTLQVFRRLPVHDSFGRANNEDIIVSIATIKLIHVQKGVSVGRKWSPKATGGRDRTPEKPVVDFESVMIGDRIDLGTATVPADSALGKSHPTERVGARFEVQVRNVAEVSAPTEQLSLASEAPAPRGDQSANSQGAPSREPEKTKPAPLAVDPKGPPILSQ